MELEQTSTGHVVLINSHSWGWPGVTEQTEDKELITAGDTTEETEAAATGDGVIQNKDEHSMI